MTVKLLPSHADTVVVGNGPSALILSYILHGHVPCYDALNPHPDPILHQKLSQSPCLFNVDVDDLTAHFGASRFSYSSQALPVNVLIDTLLRPLADTHPGDYRSCVKWRFQEENKMDHVVIGNTLHAGGQWVDNPVSASWDISALSYAEMLSLPGYSFEEHYRLVHESEPLPDLHRPTRRQVAEYLSAYPKAVGINDAVYTGIMLDGISRTSRGFHITSHGITCKNLVLASGTFSHLIPSRPLLQPLKNMPRTFSCSDAPLLVVGSGFTAADIIISAPAGHKIIHIYKWDPENHPSPLRACHRSAYPEYASIYRKMKLAASRALGADVVSPFRPNKDPFSEFDSNYEGLPNTLIKDVYIHGDRATLWMEIPHRQIIQREISNIEYVIGRRGSLEYLDDEIRQELLGCANREAAISGRTLRSKIEKDVEVADRIFAIGSLTGDSLIRFAYGSCVLTAKYVIGNASYPSMTPNGLIIPSDDEQLAPEQNARREDVRRVLQASITSVSDQDVYTLSMESQVTESTMITSADKHRRLNWPLLQSGWLPEGCTIS